MNDHDLWVAWVWNDNARDYARDFELLHKMCITGTNYPVRKPSIPLDTALRCLDLVRAELRRCRQLVAQDCAPWFDGSAFSADSYCTNKERTMELSFDIQCRYLADHFLQDYTNVREQDRDDLARCIQQAVEDWFIDREDLKAKS